MEWKLELESCLLSAWYPLFRTNTIRTIILKPLPKQFIEYLEEDGIILGGKLVETGLSGSEDGEDEDTFKVPEDRFPEFQKSIEEAIDDLGSAVLPKFSWNSPKVFDFWLTSYFIERMHFGLLPDRPSSVTVQTTFINYLRHPTG